MAAFSVFFIQFAQVFSYGTSNATFHQAQSQKCVSDSPCYTVHPQVTAPTDNHIRFNRLDRVDCQDVSSAPDRIRQSRLHWNKWRNIKRGDEAFPNSLTLALPCRRLDGSEVPRNLPYNAFSCHLCNAAPDFASSGETDISPYRAVCATLVVFRTQRGAAVATAVYHPARRRSTETVFYCETKAA